MPARGFALVLALSVLAVVMLMAASLAASAVDSERLARTERERALAFQMAEAALREAEARLAEAEPAIHELSTADWRTADLRSAGRAASEAVTGQLGAGPMPAQAPRVLLERLTVHSPGDDAGLPAEAVYRITAIGFGADARHYAVLQSLYRREAAP